MSDEFDSLDATEKAAVEGALNNAKRSSNDVVQTAPVKCRYIKAAFAQTSQAFAFAGRRISRCRAAMTPEQEKAPHVSSTDAQQRYATAEGSVSRHALVLALASFRPRPGARCVCDCLPIRWRRWRGYCSTRLRSAGCTAMCDRNVIRARLSMPRHLHMQAPCWQSHRVSQGRVPLSQTESAKRLWTLPCLKIEFRH